MKHTLRLLTSALLFLALTACGSLRSDRLQAIAAEIATAAGLAAAEEALTAAEAELSRLQAEPSHPDPLKQLATQTAIATARELVTKARSRLASFAGGK